MAEDTLCCRLTEVCCQPDHFPASWSLALWLIWEPWRALCVGNFFAGNFGGLSTDQAQELARMAPIGQELRDRDFCDEEWNRANGRKFIRCVGVQDHSKGSERQYEEDAPLEEMPQATYMITATERKWFAHLRAGMEWETTAYDCDKKIAIPPSWLTPTVTSIAQSISEEGAADHMPILADALEEAGCHDEDVLYHCRAPGQHARVCWLIELLLGTGKSRTTRST